MTPLLSAAPNGAAGERKDRPLRDAGPGFGAMLSTMATSEPAPQAGGQPAVQAGDRPPAVSGGMRVGRSDPAAILALANAAALAGDAGPSVPSDAAATDPGEPAGPSASAQAGAPMPTAPRSIPAASPGDALAPGLRGIARGAPPTPPAPVAVTAPDIAGDPSRAAASPGQVHRAPARTASGDPDRDDRGLPAATDAAMAQAVSPAMAAVAAELPPVPSAAQPANPAGDGSDLSRPAPSPHREEGGRGPDEGAWRDPSSPLSRTFSPAGRRRTPPADESAFTSASIGGGDAASGAATGVRGPRAPAPEGAITVPTAVLRAGLDGDAAAQQTAAPGAPRSVPGSASPRQGGKPIAVVTRPMHDDDALAAPGAPSPPSLPSALSTPGNLPPPSAQPGIPLDPAARPDEGASGAGSGRGAGPTVSARTPPVEAEPAAPIAIAQPLAEAPKPAPRGPRSDATARPDPVAAAATPPGPTRQLLDLLREIAPAPQAAPGTDDEASGPASAAATTPAAPVAPRVVTLAFSPQSLGRVTVTLRMRSGGLDVHIAVESKATLALLSADRHQLASALADARGTLDLAYAPPSPSTSELDSTPRGTGQAGPRGPAGEAGEGRGGRASDGRRPDPTPLRVSDHDASVAPPRRLDDSLYL